MRTLFPFLAAVCVVGAGLMAVFTGCETESATSALITVSPQSASLAYGESQTFTAQGGRSYSWSLSSSAYGTLSSRSGSSVTYTSTHATGATNPVVVLKLTGTLGASGTSDVWFAEATIMHTGTPTPPVSGLYITPASGVELEIGRSQDFTASGGAGTYAWTVSDAALAWLSRPDGAKTTLTSSFTPSGSNTTKTVFLTVKSGTQSYTTAVKLR